MKIFELYDSIVGETLSYHSTINGAVLAISDHVKKLAPALQNDYGDDSIVDFGLRYVVRSLEVRD